MQDFARLFAYSTWGVMISLGAILFTHHFFIYMEESVTVTLLILAGMGLIYFNLTFAAIKRYIRKVPSPTNSHLLLALLIALPPVGWILIVHDTLLIHDLLLLLVLLTVSATGALYGNRAGIKARYEYIQKLKEYQKKMSAG